MKTYQQEGTRLVLKPMMESGNICKCCEEYTHNAEEVHKPLEDDVECPECGALCSCKCHREPHDEPDEPAEDIDDKEPV